MPSAKPGQPPAADMSVLVNRVDELSKKAGLGALPVGATKLPLWKRWLGGEKPEYDGVDAGGLRDVVDGNAKYLDAVKGDVDTHTARLNRQDDRLAALEAQPPQVPFGA